MSAAAFDQAFVCLGELPLQVGHVLPSRLGEAYVRIVVAVTDRLRGVARYYGGQPEALNSVATSYTRWMRGLATDAVKAGLSAALAELHTEAGRACYDAELEGTGHFTCALGLAGMARDTYGIANAAWHAGVTLVRSGHLNDALKLFQLGGFQLRPCADDLRVPTLAARLARTSVTAYALMGGRDEALRYLAEANDGWGAP